MAGYARDRDGSRRPVEIPQHAIGISHSDGTYSRGRITSRRTHLMSGSDGSARSYALSPLWRTLFASQPLAVSLRPPKPAEPANTEAAQDKEPKETP
jgi:hypothetical protein